MPTVYLRLALRSLACGFLPSLFSSRGKLEGGDLHQTGCGGVMYVMAMDSSFQYVYRVSMVPGVCVLVPVVAWTLELTA